jgi:hypothetical protein
VSDDAPQVVAASPGEPPRMPGTFWPGPANPPPRAGRSARAKLLGAILIAGVGVGASALSCVGQSFSLRQARALEGIEQQLSSIHQQLANLPRGCAVTARSR